LSHVLRDLAHEQLRAKAPVLDEEACNLTGIGPSPTSDDSLQVHAIVIVDVDVDLIVAPRRSTLSSVTECVPSRGTWTSIPAL
jgi:hypothetical protein